MSTLEVHAKLKLDGADIDREVRTPQHVGISVDVSTDDVVDEIQAVGTSAENLGAGDIATPGYAYFKNLDDTNFVEIGVDNTGFVAMAKIGPGQVAMFPIADSTTLQGKADTAECRVHKVIFSA